MRNKNIITIDLKSNGIDDTKAIQKIIKYAVKKQKILFGNIEQQFILSKQLVINGNLQIYNMNFFVKHEKSVFKLKRGISFSNHQCKINSPSEKCLKLSKEQWQIIARKKFKSFRKFLNNAIKGTQKND